MVKRLVRGGSYKTVLLSAGSSASPPLEKEFVVTVCIDLEAASRIISRCPESSGR